MTRDEILAIGAAPNPQQNATMPEARAMEAHFRPLVAVRGIVVNTRSNWPVETALVPIEVIAPLADTDELMLLLEVTAAGGRVVPLSVATWHGTVTRWGPRQATKVFLDAVEPEWRLDLDLLAKVMELSDTLPTTPAIVGQPVAAMPDWDNPRTEGILGSRVGDHSKVGTVYTSPAGVKWEKGQWLSMFETAWKRVA